jgi:hypothetical protein
VKHVVYQFLLFLCPSRWELKLQHPQSAKDDKIRAKAFEALIGGRVAREDTLLIGGRVAMPS